MKEELRVFFTAIMFYTRIPCPSWVDHKEEYINKSVRYFPLIGWIVGAISGLLLLAGTWFISPMFGAIVFIGSSAWITGAFHEDGFADVCDGFGGGWTKEDILRIMKDSRVGTFAVAGLFVLLLMKVALIVEFVGLNNSFLFFLIVFNAHTMSRWVAATIIFTHKYVREDASSKVKPVAKSYSVTNIVVSSFFGLIPTGAFVFYTQEYKWLLIPFGLYLIKMGMASLFQKRIGGYTGDCLGATQQVAEVGYYFMTILLWKYI